jgi:protein transport protein SEC13
MASSTAAPAPQQGPQPRGTIYVDTQHDDFVHDAQLDFYGSKLATCSSDRTIKVYNVCGTAYEHTATLTGHEGPVWQVSWAHPKFGVILASCSFDGSVLVHRETRPREWSVLYQARGLHESSVNGIAFCPHEFGLMLATASSDGKVAILTHQPDNTWSEDMIQDNPLGVNAVSWAPFGAYSSSDTGQMEVARLVTGGCDNRIHFWIKSATTGQWEEDTSSPLGTAHAHTDWVRDVAWAPPLLPNVNVVASCSEDRTVLIWKQENGAGTEWTPTLLHTFDAPVWRVSWSVTGQVLAVSSGDNDVSLWKAGLDGIWRKMTSVQDSTPPQQQG